ncbi:MAG: hypothetical protein ACFFD2_27765, partial [Promethearchaeota archaeon]
RKTGLILIIIGIGITISCYFLLFYLSIIFGIPCIIAGIYFATTGHKTNSEWKNNPELVRKRIITLFAVCTIIIGYTCFAIWGDAVLRPFSGWSGIYAISFATPLYIVGIIIIIYAIYLIGEKWCLIYFPVALILSVIALIGIMRSTEISNRAGWFLIFPLNYIILLVIINLIVLIKRDIYGWRVAIKLLITPLCFSIGAIAGYFFGGILLSGSWRYFIGAIIFSGLGGIEGGLFNSSKDKATKMIVVGFVYTFIMVFFFYILPFLMNLRVVAVSP